MKEQPKRNKRSVWTITNKPFREAHFAVFPLDLIEPCVLAGCPEEGTILDPFAGSGTTGVVAQKHNRNAILIEISEDYIQIAKKRIGYV
jgi:DNA modification methylase